MSNSTAHTARTCSDLIGEKHTIEPRVNDAVSRAKGDTTTISNELRQRAVGNHLGISQGKWLCLCAASNFIEQYDKLTRAIFQDPTSTGLGYAAVWQKDCMTRSAWKPRHAKSFSSSRVIGPVVS